MGDDNSAENFLLLFDDDDERRSNGRERRAQQGNATPRDTDLSRTRNTSPTSIRESSPPAPATRPRAGFFARLWRWFTFAR